MTMNENREDPAATIKREIDELAELISPDLIRALSEAAEEDKLWLEAVRDARGFLHERGVALPDWAEIELEAVFPPTRVRSLEDLGALGRIEELRPPCKEGELLVARPGGRYCARLVTIKGPKPGFRFRFCLKEETEWLDWRCVDARDLGAGQVSISELSLPEIYEGPPDS
jgi:hypothetical protein